MAKAQVELVGSLSLNVGGRDFTKGRPQLITNAAEILMFQQRADFRVKMVADTQPVAEKKAEKAPSPKLAPVPEPVTEIVPDQEYEPAMLKTKAPPKYTRTKLNQMRKSDLIELGLKFSLAFSGEESVKQMVSDIMLAQED